MVDIKVNNEIRSNLDSDMSISCRRTSNISATKIWYLTQNKDAAKTQERNGTSCNALITLNCL
jgi:hypothetical protein